MAESVYKIIELVGTSSESWEKATNAAIARASDSLPRPSRRARYPSSTSNSKTVGCSRTGPR